MNYIQLYLIIVIPSNQTHQYDTDSTFLPKINMYPLRNIRNGQPNKYLSTESSELWSWWSGDWEVWLGPCSLLWWLQPEEPKGSRLLGSKVLSLVNGNAASCMWCSECMEQFGSEWWVSFVDPFNSSFWNSTAWLSVEFLFTCLFLHSPVTCLLCEGTPWNTLRRFVPDFGQRQYNKNENISQLTIEQTKYCLFKLVFLQMPIVPLLLPEANSVSLSFRLRLASFPRSCFSSSTFNLSASFSQG